MDSSAHFFATTISLQASMAFTIDRLVRDCGEDLKRVALRLTSNRADADDLVQDALERALRHAPSAIGAARLRYWIVCVLRNRFFDQRRSRSAQLQAIERLRQEAAALHGLIFEESIPLWRRVDMGFVRAAIAQLPPDLRTVLEMSVSSVPQAKIAATMKVQPATVRTRLLRARTRVRSLLMSASSSPGPPSDGSDELGRE